MPKIYTYFNSRSQLHAELVAVLQDGYDPVISIKEVSVGHIQILVGQNSGSRKVFNLKISEERR